MWEFHNDYFSVVEIRALSLITFLIKCRRFQQALPCAVLRDTSRVSLPQILRCRAPGRPLCLDCVREGNPAASRLLSTNVGTRSPRGCWLLVRVRRRPTVTAPVGLMGLLQGTDTADLPCPSGHFHSTGVGSAD